MAAPQVGGRLHERPICRGWLPRGGPRLRGRGALAGSGIAYIYPDRRSSRALAALRAAGPNLGERGGAEAADLERTRCRRRAPFGAAPFLDRRGVRDAQRGESAGGATIRINIRDPATRERAAAAQPGAATREPAAADGALV